MVIVRRQQLIRLRKKAVLTTKGPALFPLWYLINWWYASDVSFGLLHISIVIPATKYDVENVCAHLPSWGKVRWRSHPEATKKERKRRIWMLVNSLYEGMIGLLKANSLDNNINKSSFVWHYFSSRTTQYIKSVTLSLTHVNKPLASLVCCLGSRSLCC